MDVQQRRLATLRTGGAPLQAELRSRTLLGVAGRARPTACNKTAQGNALGDQAGSGTALKGRKKCPALTGLGVSLDSPPRALPWAVLFRSFRASASEQAQAPTRLHASGCQRMQFVTHRQEGEKAKPKNPTRKQGAHGEKEGQHQIPRRGHSHHTGHGHGKTHRHQQTACSHHKQPSNPMAARSATDHDHFPFVADVHSVCGARVPASRATPLATARPELPCGILFPATPSAVQKITGCETTTDGHTSHANPNPAPAFGVGLLWGQPAALEVLEDGSFVALSRCQENQPAQHEHNPYH